MIDGEHCAAVVELVARTRRDLSHVEDLIAAEGDCLVALVLLARAARSTDDALFMLLDARATGSPDDPWKIPIGGMIGSVQGERSFQ